MTCMSKIVVIIFSFDRAMQLDALLQSFYQNIKLDQVEVKMVVLYRSSNDLFEAGYTMIKEKYINHGIFFINELMGERKSSLRLLFFPRNLYRWLKYPTFRQSLEMPQFKIALEKSLRDIESDNVMFLTDDSLFYAEATICSDLFSSFYKRPDLNFFSLRHGRNIKNTPTRMNKYGDYYRWTRNDTDCDSVWSYPFSVDGHIYNKENLLNLIKDILYANPNTFEGCIADHINRDSCFLHGFCFEKSILASFPINKVQNEADNEHLGVDNTALNNRYLEGFSLKYEYDNNPNTFQQIPARLILTRGDEAIDYAIFDDPISAINIR